MKDFVEADESFAMAFKVDPASAYINLGGVRVNSWPPDPPAPRPRYRPMHQKGAFYRR